MIDLRFSVRTILMDLRLGVRRRLSRASVFNPAPDPCGPSRQCRDVLKNYVDLDSYVSRPLGPPWGPPKPPNFAASVPEKLKKLQFPLSFLRFRWMMRGMRETFRSWKAGKWHPYATFVRFHFHKLLHMPAFIFFRCLPTPSTHLQK